MEESGHDLLLPRVKDENICLPLSINAVSSYWNISLPVSESLEIAKKYPNVNGSILIEGIELAERHGLGSLILRSSLSELKKNRHGNSANCNSSWCSKYRTTRFCNFWI